MRRNTDKIKEQNDRVPVEKITTRIEGIPVWAIPGVDPRDDLPDRVPDEALDRMKDKHAKVVKERRRRESGENAA